MKRVKALLQAAAIIMLAACADNGDPIAPISNGSIRGTVTDDAGATVANAAVALTGNGQAARTANSGADGAYMFSDVPPGTYALAVTPPSGFTIGSSGTASVTVASGTQANASAIVLNRTAPDPAVPLFTHGNAVAYLPPGVAEYKAAIVFLPGLRDPATGNSLDSRALVRGTSSAGCSIWCLPNERALVRSRALELAGGSVALIGTTTLLDNATDYTTLINALTEFGRQSQHPELANIPIFFVGHSQGGCTAYGFSRVHGARVAGFLTMKGGCHNQGGALAAANVPGYFLIGALDEPHRRDNITGVFENGRAAGAPWALSTDAFHHGPIVDFDLMFDWIDTILTARLPLTSGGALRPIAETSGWLGARSSGAISTYACYSSPRPSAAWLPTRETALHWQRMAGGSAVVSAC